MTRRIFDDQLSALTEEIHEMGQLVLQALKDVFVALENRDIEALMRISTGDRQINDMEKSIESKSLHLLMKQQPVVAGDLRAVSAALKLATDLERIGDQAQDIADIGLNFCSEERDPMNTSAHLAHMSQRTIAMVGDSLKALYGSDVALAREVQARDDQVDDLFDTIKKELVAVLKADGAVPDNVIDILMISKYLERIADHAVNVGEWVVFHQTGIHQTTKII